MYYKSATEACGIYAGPSAALAGNLTNDVEPANGSVRAELRALNFSVARAHDALEKLTSLLGEVMVPEMGNEIGKPQPAPEPLRCGVAGSIKVQTDGINELCARLATLTSRVHLG